MHAAAFAQLGLPHTYEALSTRPGELSRRVRELREGALAGLNVTLPFKCEVLGLADVVLPAAALAGAANTLYVSGGLVHATNTDTPALVAEVRSLVPEVSGAVCASPALVIGNGGAARAAVIALAVDLGAVDVVVRARSGAALFAAEMRGLIRRHGSLTRVIGEPLAASSGDGRFGCIIQATSAGMAGADPGESVAAAVDWQSLRAGAWGREGGSARAREHLRACAAGRGLRPGGCPRMLARQGALAFALWLDCDPPVAAMRSALLSARPLECDRE